LKRKETKRRHKMKKKNLALVFAVLALAIIAAPHAAFSQVSSLNYGESLSDKVGCVADRDTGELFCDLVPTYKTSLLGTLVLPREVISEILAAPGGAIILITLTGTDLLGGPITLDISPGAFPAATCFSAGSRVCKGTATITDGLTPATVLETFTINMRATPNTLRFTLKSQILDALEAGLFDLGSALFGALAFTPINELIDAEVSVTTADPLQPEQLLTTTLVARGAAAAERLVTARDGTELPLNRVFFKATGRGVFAAQLLPAVTQ
jgi:hypothetical protein